MEWDLKNKKHEESAVIMNQKLLYEQHFIMSQRT